jgi:hypothetical protein
MKKIDNLTNKELSEYIRKVYDEPGPFQIDSWYLYQLNHTPSPTEIEKVERVLKSFEFNEDDEYLITLRATRTHIRNYMLNMICDIESNMSEFNEVFTEVKKDIENGEVPIF